jgi:hypothetical protein
MGRLLCSVGKSRTAIRLRLQDYKPHGYHTQGALDESASGGRGSIPVSAGVRPGNVAIVPRCALRVPR